MSGPTSLGHIRLCTMGPPELREFGLRLYEVRQDIYESRQNV
jgi:hypothetical protein